MPGRCALPTNRIRRAAAGAVALGLLAAPLATRAQSPPPASPAAADAKPAATRAAKPPSPVAKVAFGAMRTPAPLAARSIGSYAKGCLAGAKPLPIDGPAWQAMRLSRNRNWGHPDLIALVERLAVDARKDGWPGLLVGDISQPRGGPMLTGHASHQIGLDADIWLTRMPNRRLTEQEREEIEATSMLGPDKLHVDPAVWSADHVKLIKRAASYPQVERILVHPGIKKALCEAAGTDRHWLAKVRPYWGHFYHMHVRIACPHGSTGCVAQKPTTGDDGCGKEVEDWLTLLAKPEKPSPPDAKAPPKRLMTVDQLPAECKVVLESGQPSAIAKMRALHPGAAAVAPAASGQASGMGQAASHQ